MINIIAKTINIFALTLQNALSAASFVGQLIVTVFASMLCAVHSVVTNSALFFQIIYEDNVLIFTEDLPTFGNHLIETCSQQWSQVQHSVSQTVCEWATFGGEGVAELRQALGAAVTVLAEVLLLLKKALVFTGDTLWLILTFIPVQLPLLISYLVKCMADVAAGLVVYAYSKLLKLTNFLTDVPLQSLTGIISAILIVRLCIHFREQIEVLSNRLYWLISRQLLYLYHAMYNYYTDSEVRAISRLAVGPEVAGADSEDEVGDPAEALCVVCQERQKCVLILPCRHVCLCRECCMRLYGYQRTCPICRTFIYHSVTIYL